MKEIPILFNAEMVRAILERQKTQTRRPIKGVPRFKHLGRDIMKWPLSGVYADDGKFFLDVQTDVDDCWTKELHSPFGSVGDHLWVRETFWEGTSSFTDQSGEDVSYWTGKRQYAEERAMPGPLREPYIRGVPWMVKRPSIHMPRAASRITLKVTDIRVQRVQEISEEDAMAEGGWNYRNCPVHKNPVRSFGELWQSIYGTWDENPWVWAATFEVVK